VSDIFTFVFKAVCVAEETGLSSSEVFSTFSKPSTIALVIPPTVPVNCGLLIGALAANLFVRFKEAVSVFEAYMA
jgi:hypothetical protein